MTATHHSIIERLSEYLDGELDAPDRARIDEHLSGCDDCRRTAEELRAVAARAASLVDVPPQQDLWSGIAGRLHGRPSRLAAFRARAARRFSFTLPQLAAASIALMVLSGGLVWLAKAGDPRADFPAATGADLSPGIAPARLTDTHYEGAIEDLEQILARGRSQLDAETVRVLEENLRSIDAAIEQCRRALDRDPANAYLNSHLAAARQRKLALLRRATALTAGS